MEQYQRLEVTVAQLVKQLHARWVIAFFRHMQPNAGKKIIQNGFNKAHVREAYEQASQLSQLTDNPFLEISMLTASESYFST